MKKLVLLAALFAAVSPAIKAQDSTEEGEVKSFCVGEFENPGEAEVKMGAGSWWEEAPFQFYTRHSGIQIIYDAQYLQPLADDNGSITEIVFKMGDEGSYVTIESDLTLYIQNIEDTEFVKKPDTEKYMWITYDPESSCSTQQYEVDLFYMEDVEFHFVLDKPLKYEGKNLLITAWSNVTNNEETNYLYTYAMGTDARTCMMMGSDKADETFEDIYASGLQYPYMSPLKYVPVTKFMYTASSGINSVGADASNNTPRYFNLQGQEVSGDLMPGIYIRSQGDETKKVMIR